MEEEENLNKRVVRLALGAVLFVLAIVCQKQSLSLYIYLPLFFTSYLVLGFGVVKEAIENLFKGQLFDENFLMSIATIGAIVLGDYKEAVAVMLFYMIGETAQDVAVDSSVKNIEKTMNLIPDKAHLLDGNTIKDVDPKDVKVGQIVRVKVGEKVPVDGKVFKGSFLGDTSSLTGESLPCQFKEGSAILAGTIVLDSSVDIVCDTEFKSNTISKIMDMVEKARENKAETEDFITRFAKVYTPSVVLLAVFLAVVPSLITENWRLWTYRALEFLVISCPCALVISIPLTFFAGIGACAKNGILVKGSNHLEMLSKVKVFAFDKTGTLTKGKFEVKEFVNLSKRENNEILCLSLSLEDNSTHPLARAIVTYCKERKASVCNVIQSKEIPGLGLKGTIRLGEEEFDVLCGNEKLVGKVKEEAGSDSVVYISVNNEVVGYFVISDSLKDGVSDSVAQLKRLGIKKTVLLTGDRRSSAKKVANEACLDEFYSELLPQDKVEKIEKLRESGQTAFVGDGINDSPVLVASDVGISMGRGGSDSAISASGIVIAKDEVEKIPLACKIAKKTVAIARENIAVALAVKILFLLLSALGLCNMAFAVFADVGVCLICVINSLRALGL